MNKNLIYKVQYFNEHNKIILESSRIALNGKPKINFDYTYNEHNKCCKSEMCGIDDITVYHIDDFKDSLNESYIAKMKLYLVERRIVDLSNDAKILTDDLLESWDFGIKGYTFEDNKITFQCEGVSYESANYTSS